MTTNPPETPPPLDPLLARGVRAEIVRVLDPYPVDVDRVADELVRLFGQVGAFSDDYVDGRASLVADLYRLRTAETGIRGAVLVVAVDTVLRALDRRGLLR